MKLETQSITPSADTSRDQIASPQQVAELGLSRTPGVPGIVMYSNVPNVTVPSFIRTLPELGGLQFYGSTAHMPEADMRAVATAMGGLGQVVFMKSVDDITDSSRRCKYHMYANVGKDDKKAIEEAFGKSNNIVDFTRKIKEVGGEVAKVLDNALKIGGAVLMAVVALLWEIGRVSFSASNEPGSKDSRTT
jgi:hypothetical protein